MALIRLGTASPSTQSTTAETLRLLSSIARRASTQSIDILLLPEAFIGGYPHARVNKTREAFAEYFDQAVDLGDVAGGAGAGDAWAHRELGRPGEKRGDGTREELEEIARSTGVFIVTGIIEKVGGSLYGSVVYVCPKLGIIGKRRKVNPTDIERLFWAQGAPSTLHAVSTTIRGVRINLAAAICWESYMPMVRQALYAQNINLYLAPNSDDSENWLNCMQNIGFEGRCFVVGSNMCLRGTPSGQGTRINGIGSAMERHGGTASLQSASPARRRRRKSVFDNDGNEIVLCCPADESPAEGVNGVSAPEQEKNDMAGSAAPVTNTAQARRRNSVIDEDGNEIVLCRAAKEDEAPDLVPNGVPETSENDKVGSLPSAAPARRRRRKSVFDSDGNEIVLCCPDDGNDDTSTITPHGVTTTTGAAGSTSYTGPWTSRGGSCIVSPFGKVLAGPQWEDDEGLIYSDVDFRECVRGRSDLDGAGSYSCNDSFKFSVDGLNLEPLPY